MRWTRLSRLSLGACSGADDGPWRQSEVLRETRVQLQIGLIAPREYDLGADDAAE